MWCCFAVLVFPKESGSDKVFGVSDTSRLSGDVQM